MIEILKLPNKAAYMYALYAKSGFYGDENRCMGIAKRKASYNKSKYIDYCLRRYGYMKKTFVELRLNADEEILRVTNYPVLGCNSCGIGMFPATNNKKEINDLMLFEKEQRQKYNGQYVCSHCENKRKNFKQLGETYLLSDSGFGKNGMILTNCGIKPPGTALLGFAGRWFLVIKTDGELFISNNMIDKGSLPNVFKDEWMPYINCTIKGFSSVKDLKNLLTEEQYIMLSNQKDFKAYCQYHPMQTIGELK